VKKVNYLPKTVARYCGPPARLKAPVAHLADLAPVESFDVGEDGVGGGGDGFEVVLVKIGVLLVRDCNHNGIVTVRLR